MISLQTVPLVLVVPLQTVLLQSIMHELDECFILCKGTVWRGITVTQGRMLNDRRSNIPMCYLGNTFYILFNVYSRE